MVDTKGIGDQSGIVQKWGEKKRRIKTIRFCLFIIIIIFHIRVLGFPSGCNAGDPGSVPESGRSP